MTPSPSEPSNLGGSEQPGSPGARAWEFKAIGIIRTCFREKFGIPRQPGLAPSAGGILTLRPPFNQPEMVRELAGFSHIWVLFVFHALAAKPLKSTVRPPRLGGRRRIGVLASRSGYRPNPIGLSVVELAAVEMGPKGPALHLRGVDFLDRTPVLDVKPYLPYADCLPAAKGGYSAGGPPEPLPVTFSPRALKDLECRQRLDPEQFKQLITETLSQDPRPAHERAADPERCFGTVFWDVNVRWRVAGQQVEVLSVTPPDRL